MDTTFSSHCTSIVSVTISDDITLEDILLWIPSSFEFDIEEWTVETEVNALEVTQEINLQHDDSETENVQESIVEEFDQTHEQETDIAVTNLENILASLYLDDNGLDS